jgi:hypothetical protein
MQGKNGGKAVWKRGFTAVISASFWRAQNAVFLRLTLGNGGAA